MTKHVYMNNAATSWPKPECVAEAMAEAVRALPGAANRGGIEDVNVFDEVRKELVLLMGVSCPEQIALGCNSTWGLNEALFGWPLEKGDTVLSTNAEHNAVLRPLHRLEKEGIRTVYVPADAEGRVCPRRWADMVKEYRPRFCVLNHASNVTGAVNDAAAMCASAHEYGAAFLLDMSQTLGYIPVELEAWGVDLAAFTGHKYLLGPQGTGGLYVRPGIHLRPHMVGGTGVKSDLREMPEEMPVHLEAGTGNEPSYHGLLAALRWSGEHPADREQVSARVRRLADGLAAMGCRVIRPKEPCMPVLSFAVPGYTPEEAGDILTGSYDIICRTGLHCAPALMEDIGMPGGTVRLSLSRFTTEKEVDEVLEAVKDLTESV